MSGLLEGLRVIPQTVHRDPDRGGASFAEAYNERRVNDLGLPSLAVAQLNVAHSPIGTLRGLHAEPWEKYIYVARGRVHVALVDLRRASATFGQVWENDIDDSVALLIPRGIANGYQALTDDVTYLYLTTEVWDADATYVAVAWDDPDLAISWPITDDRLKLSQKDRSNPPFREVEPFG